MRLFKYVIKIETKTQLLLGFLVILTVLLGFYNISLEGRIIDEAIEKSRGDLLIRLCLTYFVIILVTTGLSYITDVLFNEVTQKILIRLRTELFNHVLRLDQSFFARTPPGDVISRIVTEVQQLGAFLSRIIPVPLSCIITIIAGFGLIAKIDLRLAVASLGIYSAVFFFMPGLRAKIREISQSWSRRMRHISRQTEESISHFTQIQTSDTYAFEEYRFGNSLWQFFHTQMKLAKAYAATGFLSQFFSELSNLTVYALGGYLIIKSSQSSLSVGAVFITIRVLANIIKPVNTLIDFFQKAGEAQVKFDMISDYLEMDVQMTDPAEPVECNSIKGSVAIEDVSFGYSEGEEVIKNFSLQIEPGQKIALVGPAGCGKSTVALLISRMIRPSKGSILIDGIPAEKISQGSFRRLTGYVAQAKTNWPVMFGGTLADNLVYGLKTAPSNPGDTPEGWLDLKSAGYRDLTHLYDTTVDTIREVGFYRDVFDFGLTKNTLHQALSQKDDVFSIKNPEAIRTEVMKGRKKFRELIDARDRRLIEFFHQDSYMDYCSILENIMFTSPEPFTQNRPAYDRLIEILGPICQKTGIYDKIVSIGCNTVTELALLASSLKLNRSQLASHLDLPPTGARMDLESISKELKKRPRDNPQLVLGEYEYAQVVKVGFEYVLATGIDVYIDDEFKRKALEARRIFRETGPGMLKESVSFYDGENYVDGATIRQNIIMGKVNAQILQADSRVRELVDQVIKEIELEDEIICLGLLSEVGERGSRLSGGQSQKAVLTRVLLKNPHILIMDEATSALDNHSQETVNEMLKKRFAGRTVITVAHRLSAIREYDQIAVMNSGRIEEKGDFSRLMEKKGLFYRLWNTASGGG